MEDRTKQALVEGAVITIAGIVGFGLLGYFARESLNKNGLEGDIASLWIWGGGAGIYCWGLKRILDKFHKAKNTPTLETKVENNPQPQTKKSGDTHYHTHTHYHKDTTINNPQIIIPPENLYEQMKKKLKNQKKPPQNPPVIEI